MIFLERNLEQLTVVQRQLVEQNSSLKKEVAIAERKLIARNERIQSLESLLQDSQEKLTAANHRYVSSIKYYVPGTNTPQLRIPTYRRQGAPRGRKGWLNKRSWVVRRRSVLRIRRRRRFTNRKAPAWWRWRRPCSSHHWQSAEGRRGRAKEQAHKLVLQAVINLSGHR
jgi:hypothetical protein